MKNKMIMLTIAVMALVGYMQAAPVRTAAQPKAAAEQKEVSLWDRFTSAAKDAAKETAQEASKIAIAVAADKAKKEVSRRLGQDDQEDKEEDVSTRGAAKGGKVVGKTTQVAQQAPKSSLGKRGRDEDEDVNPALRKKASSVSVATKSAVVEEDGVYSSLSPEKLNSKKQLLTKKINELQTKLANIKDKKSKGSVQVEIREAQDQLQLVQDEMALRKDKSSARKDEKNLERQRQYELKKLHEHMQEIADEQGLTLGQLFKQVQAAAAA